MNLLQRFIKPTQEPRRQRIWFESVDRLRLILMLLGCINLFGFPFSCGDHVQTLMGFVAPACFLISGFLILAESEHRLARILRSVKRCALAFALLAAFYLAVNVWYGAKTGENPFAVLTSGRTWFEFLLLNVWPFPIGVSIWYVQALLYAELIAYFLDKFHLLDKIGLWLAAALFLFSLASGEFADLLGFRPFGYAYLPGNFLTRALPYLLFGGILARYRELFFRVPPILFPIGTAVGIGLTAAEYFLLDLSYPGHLFGNLLIAPCFCMIAFLYPMDGFFDESLAWFGSFATPWIYALCPVAAFLLERLLPASEEGSWVGILTFVLCALAVFLVGSAIRFLYIVLLERGILPTPDEENSQKGDHVQ